MFIAVLFTTAKIWKQLKFPSMDEWINVWYIYTMEYYSSIKKNETRLFAAIWINLKIILIDIYQTEKVKYHMILLICRILKKNDVHELIWKIETDLHSYRTNLWLPWGYWEWGDEWIASLRLICSHHYI